MQAGPDSTALAGVVAFTGRLASMQRSEAFYHVSKRRGRPRSGVTQDTSILIVGELGWPLLSNGLPSNSLQKARRYAIPIVSERCFLGWIGIKPAREIEQSHTIDQVAQITKMPVELLDELAAFGLLNPTAGRFGFRDLASARQLAGLFRAGVTVGTVVKSLHEIRKWLPTEDLSSLKFETDGSGALTLCGPGGRTSVAGQYLLPVQETPRDANTLFEEAVLAEETGNFENAERLYRKAMNFDDGDPAIPFNLGNLLRSLKRPIEAELAYRGAIKVDRSFAEAWFNLAELLNEVGRNKEAIQALRATTKANPNFADAFYNLGRSLQKQGLFSEAIEAWRRYLDLDPNSDWSKRARRSLKYCELEIASEAKLAS